MTDSNDKIKVSLISLGCDKNLVESESMLGALDASGCFIFTPDEEEAEVVIINTCGFIKDAVDEAGEHIRRVLLLKEEGICRAVIVTGCMVQRYKEQLANDFAGVDRFVSDAGKTAGAVLEVLGLTAIPLSGAGVRILSTPSHYAYLKIAEGCDNRCAYCAIPFIKGSYVSRSLEEIVLEARGLADRGVKELILVAQDTALYGKDLYGRQVIGTLLAKLSEIKGIEWIRMMYCYPEHITDELIDEIAGNPKVCSYIDMPVQHSSGNVVRRMGRKMDAEGLRGLIGKIRGKIPGVALRTTVITGFPGETREDFQGLLEFLKEIKFDRLGAFAYSREEGTAAYDMPEQIPEKTKAARRNRVMELQNALSAEKLQSYEGTVLKVLIDGYDEVNKVYYGRSFMDCPDIDGLVFLAAKKGSILPGNFVDVSIKYTLDYDLFGEIAEVR